MGIDHPGDRRKVHVTDAAGDTLCHRNAFFGRFVCQHRPANHITNRPHTRDTRRAVRIHLYRPLRVQVDAAAGFKQAIRTGPAPNGDNQPFYLNAPILPGSTVSNGAAAVFGDHFGYLTSEPDIKTLTGELFFCLAGDHRVSAGEHGIHCLENDDLGTQTTPYASEFKPDDAGANDAEGLWYCGKRQCAGGIKNRLIVHLHARQFNRLGAACQDNVVSPQELLRLVI